MEQSKEMPMSSPLVVDRADPLIVQTWVNGWALSRGTPAPTPLSIGYRIDVGLPQHVVRYVLPEFQPAVVSDLATSIDAPWIFIKVCAEPLAVAEILPRGWTVEAPVFLMVTALSENGHLHGDSFLPQGYTARVIDEGSVIRVRIEHISGDVAATGQCGLYEESCIFDQIITDEAHRRRGLGSAVMKLLSTEAVARGNKQGVLVASIDGLALYGTIGWTVHSPVTSAVIMPA